MTGLVGRIGTVAASRAQSARCRIVRAVLPEIVVEGVGERPDWMRAHLSSCLVCRSEADRLADLDRAMAARSAQAWAPPLTLVNSVMDRLDDIDGRSHPTTATLAAVGLGATAVGVTVWAAVRAWSR